ncbi:hypothetical protein KSP40_PGU019761 [Platanthera guangdongensis]|uniref:Rab-GAP TBC domain-containing protein n=1 Tax=Platanthera guangdongensis TaxID=2320717 RepID=A0ABR2LLG1_9ASPA
MKRKRGLSRRYWNSLFTPDGRLRDGGIRFLRRARSTGIDPSIRSEVWPFLLGVYDLKSSDAERRAVKLKHWKEYENLRRRCRVLSNNRYHVTALVTAEACHNPIDDTWSEDYTASIPVSLKWGSRCDEDRPVFDRTPDSSPRNSLRRDHPGVIQLDAFLEENDSSDSDFSGEVLEPIAEPVSKLMSGACLKSDAPNRTVEDFRTWQRIIRLDAIRANADWIIYSQAQVTISQELANYYASSIGLKDYNHLEPCVVYHAYRLVSVLEAYSVYDPEIGYCQGMSDLLSPILVVMEDDYEAFWCFVCFMRKARQNFRLDEIGIRRQLGVVSRIIRSKDVNLYRHLEKLQAEDCLFVYRWVLVLFRREMSFEQAVALWEVVWADQAAIREGIGRLACGRVTLRAAPNDDLLLYAIAACVLQRRKMFTERHSGVEEIIRECNDMAGKLDVWRLLDDAHDLVASLHDKIKLSLF